MPDRSRAALIATPPRSTAEKSFNAPSRRPIGVRAPPTMTERDMEPPVPGRRRWRPSRQGGPRGPRGIGLPFRIGPRSSTGHNEPSGPAVPRPGRDPCHIHVTSQTSRREDAPVTNETHAGLPGELFRTIDHVGIAVPDLDEAIAFYAQAFGVQSVHEETNEEQGVREAMLAVGNGDTRIQLLAPLTPESTIAKFIGRSGPGLQQLAFRVADVEAVSATLRERGLRLLYDAPKRGTAGSRVNFVHPKDAGGVLVELVEPAGDAGH